MRPPRVQTRPFPSVLVGFARIAEQYADRIAVDAVDGALDFAELERRASAVAHALRERGVGRGSVVALSLGRTTALIVAMIGVWQAGGAFVLLDPDEPRASSRDKIEAAGVTLVVADDMSVERSGFEVTTVRDQELRAGTVQVLDDVAADDLAYVVFTSGSSGRPKGVAIEHGSLVHHCSTQLEQIYAVVADGAPRRIGSAAPLWFDSFLDQVLPMMLYGHTIVLLSEEQRFAVDSYVGAELDVVDCAPSQLAVLVAHGLLERDPPVDLIVFGGEKPSAELWARLRASGVPAFSIYGATECAIGTMTADVREFPGVTLGRPPCESPVLVLSEDGQQVSPGGTGEIVITGPGVGRGYVGMPDRTAEVFGTNPDGLRWYRTGDLGRLHADGSIEFIARMDDQVKVRGVRIEPGHVEHALESLPEAGQVAVVTDAEDGPAGQLLAFYTGDAEWVELRRLLARRLPRHMVPDVGHQLRTIPLTPAGKVDRRALRELHVVSGRRQTAPSERPSGVQELLVWECWRAALGRTDFGVDEEFVQLGGNSLAALDVIGGIQQRWPGPVDVGRLLRAGTVREQAAVLAATSDDSTKEA